MTSSDPNQPDPRIIRILPDRHDTTELAGSLAPSSMSENEPRWVWKFGNMVFNTDRSNVPEAEERLERRSFGGPDAGGMEYGADGESGWNLGSSPSTTPPRPPPVDSLSTTSHPSGSNMGSVLPRHVRHLIFETGDEANNSGVESSDLTSSESLVPTPIITSEDMEDTESVGPRENYETELMFKWTLTDLIRQMMFVSGETAEPSIESTTLIEDITRQQVIEIVRFAAT
ncbi:transcription initiation factor IID 18kD subunit-domain-containing protein [Penicillium sp. IBT 18751x]|nr:transcription initiation factor IID 18kD subunit-domain-containing protein [Penicillium sp. IBT 18751x]